MKKILRKVKIDSIDTNDLTFIYTFPVRIDEIIESIRKIHFLNPVILIEYDGKYRIISGLKRILACKSLSFDMIDAFVFESDSISELEAFLIAVYDNMSIRRLNIIEKSVILNKLRMYHNLKDSKIIDYYMPVIGLGKSRKLLNDYLLLSKFDDVLKEHIVHRDISIRVSSLLASVSEEKLSLISEVIIKFNLGGNKIKELLGLVDEIIERDDTNPRKLRSDLELEAVLKDERLTLSQKWDKIISSLRDKRFPMWSKLEKGLLQDISSLNLPRNIHFIYPPYLEGDKFRIEAEFSSTDELKEFGQKLIDVSKSKELSKIIKHLF
ncbi:ParB/RepB/Spo0J family partition protein [candidate division KSB1 bacterium]